MTDETHLLAATRGSLIHFALTTVPLVLVLAYFLYEAWKRPSIERYQLGDNYTDEEFEAATKDPLFRLTDILSVFLSLHVWWTCFAIYMITFVPKRRHLMGRYLAEGEPCVGDVVYDKRSRYFGSFHDYGYAIYAHPTQKKMIRKRVRVYQQYTREKVTILRLPNRPLSGLPKVDIEIDMNVAMKERDVNNQHLAIYSLCWIAFTFVSSIFILGQIRKLPELDGDRDSYSRALKIFWVVIGLNVPFSYGANWVRFLGYRNWLVNRGAVVDNHPDLRKVRGCLMDAKSEDGSDVIPYSVLDGEDTSYQGSIPSHSQDCPPIPPMI